VAPPRRQAIAAALPQLEMVRLAVVGEVATLALAMPQPVSQPRLRRLQFKALRPHWLT
jgi:hypothetical protein|tara:strand:- start:75 stop:248 length:174 start_codon:yes stop_codon:yes gene_type:complete